MNALDGPLYRDSGLIKNWYCIYTKPKQEDLVSRRLIEIPEIEVFNPKLKQKRYVRGRLKEAVEELFPCYIFSKFNPDRYYHMVKYTRGIRRIVGNKGAPFIVDESIIALIRSRVKEGFVNLEPLEFKSGEQVVIKDGPFSGLMGIFLRGLKARERVLVLLNTIAYQAKIEIDRCLLSKQKIKTS